MNIWIWSVATDSSPIVQFLSDWQPLLGGLAGGIFAITAALIVAYSERRRSDRAAATLVVSRLAQIKIIADATEQAITEQGESFLEAAREVAELPGAKSSTAFGETIFRLAAVDEGLAPYLDSVHKLLRMADREFDRGRELLRRDEDQANRSLSNGLECVMNAGEHARLALPGAMLVMRSGIAAAIRRLIRRWRIRIGQRFRGRWQGIYPEDIRPLLREEGPLENRSTWDMRLKESLDIDDFAAWKLKVKQPQDD